MEVLAEGKIVDPITGLEKEFALTIDDSGDVSYRVYWGWDMYLLPLPEEPPIK